VIREPEGIIAMNDKLRLDLLELSILYPVADMQSRPTRLADNRASPPVFIPATIIRQFPTDRLTEIEAIWSPARVEVATLLQSTGFDLESSHWDWTGKAERVATGELSLIAVECEGQVQGLMAIPHQSRLSVFSPGKRLVYVDYLEAAPWNQRVPGQSPSFLGVGKSLIAQAIHISRELGMGGRVGLHSLPQAEGFYAKTCQMMRIGPDPGYYNLVYFEYTENAADNWLDAEGIPG
jgi:hypothetical protein